MTRLWTLPLELTPAGGAFDDPALLVAPTNTELSILFDCGTLHGLKTRDLQKVRWLFLTHLHIDHLIGFDHLLRVRLFSNLPLTVYGPSGTLEALSHRLQGYAWNLTSGSPFEVRVIECDSALSPSARFRCHERFQREALEADHSSELPDSSGEIRLETGLTVTSHPVRHGVPCLAYRLLRRSLPKFSLVKAQSLGLTPGPWVRQLVSGQAVSQIVSGEERDQRWLSQELLCPPTEHSLGFLTDTRLDDRLTELLAEFYKGVDVLCSEAAYLHSEATLAEQNMHMTTFQVAELARRCGARELRLFHFSRRHCETGTAPHLAEVRQVFEEAYLLSEASRAASESLS